MSVLITFNKLTYVAFYRHERYVAGDIDYIGMLPL